MSAMSAVSVGMSWGPERKFENFFLAVYKRATYMHTSVSRRPFATLYELVGLGLTMTVIQYPAQACS
jgi:hypothetical protein